MRSPFSFFAGLAIWLLLLIPARTAAHTIDSDDNAWLLRDGRHFRFEYANDFFAGTDRYYTQGYGFDLFHPVLSKSPVMRLLVFLPGGSKYYGLTFRHRGYTPSRVSSDDVRLGDRPFASYLFLGHTLVSMNPERTLTLITELDVGLIGPWAGGKQIQTTLHRAFENAQPQGWDDQIRNDLVLDYAVRLEKGVARAAYADTAIFAAGTLGTLYTSAGVGLAGRLGKIRDGNNRLYVLGRIEEKVIGYDATLQGGLFNRNSPSTLGPRAVERAVGRADVGVALERAGYALQFTRSFQSREFKSGRSHQWGEISFIKYF